MPSSEVYLSNEDYDHHRDALIERAIAAYKEAGEYKDQFGEGEIKENTITCLIRISINRPYSAIIGETISDPMRQRRVISLLRKALTADQATIIKEAREQGEYFRFKGICEIFSKNLEKAKDLVGDYDPHIADDKLPVFAEALAKELRKGIKTVCDKLSPELEAKIAKREQKGKAVKEEPVKAEGDKKRPHASVEDGQEATEPNMKPAEQTGLAARDDSKEGSPPAAKIGRLDQSRGGTEATSPAPVPARVAGSAFRASSPNILNPGKSSSLQSMHSEVLAAPVHAARVPSPAKATVTGKREAPEGGKALEEGGETRENKTARGEDGAQIKQRDSGSSGGTEPSAAVKTPPAQAVGAASAAPASPSKARATQHD